MADKRTIEKVLFEQKQELRLLAQSEICSRREERMVDMDSSMAQVVIGVRRSGKSTMCYNILRNHKDDFAYINFDDERLSDVSTGDLDVLLEILYKVYGNFSCLFLDEIQNIDGWHLFVNRLLRQKMHILVTGSNAKLLGGELATHLTGRYEKTEMFPFSFSEFCDFKGVNTQMQTTKDEAFVRQAFDEYLRQGGFPELVNKKNKTRYIETLLDNIVKRDIEQRYKMKYASAFERLTQHLLNVAPVIVVESELATTVGIKSHHTVNNYIDYLKQAYVVSGLHKYSTKSKQRIRDEKLYPIDVAFMDSRKDAMAGENLGWRLETLVYIELLRRTMPEAKSVFYYKSAEGYEADFVVCRGNMVEQIYQVCYDLSNGKTRQRELRGLIAAANETKCRELYLITDFQRENLDVNGMTINVIPAYEWMLLQ